MSAMPERDIQGEGEGKDLVKEAEKERQAEIEKAEAETTEETPRAPGAEKRNAPPGSMGGHA
jgi:hypothetical protein